MVFYVTSHNYNEVIHRAVTELDIICAGNECSNEMYLLKYIKENLNRLGALDYLIIDLNALQDTDDEILQALDMVRILNCETRIIIIAASRVPGDALLTKCVEMGIYDVIVSNVFAEIFDELKISLTVGKKYGDALRLKKSDTANGAPTVEKKEFKRTVNKILVGITGVQPRIGCSHLAITTANHLRSKGYMVALVEYGPRGIWESIREAYGESLMEERYFSLNGVDYYGDTSESELQSMLAVKFYNFIVVDFGLYESTDQFLYNKCDIRMLVTGAKPWETQHIGKIFQSTSQEQLQQINYVFNFVPEDSKMDIKREMSGLDNIYFMQLTEDPFSAKQVGDISSIFDFYEQQEVPAEKRKAGLFSKLRSKK